MEGHSSPTETRASASVDDSGLHCPHCEYNLTGLLQNRCPECESNFDPRQLAEEKARRASLLRWSPALTRALWLPLPFAACVVLARLLLIAQPGFQWWSTLSGIALAGGLLVAATLAALAIIVNSLSLAVQTTQSIAVLVGRNCSIARDWATFAMMAILFLGAEFVMCYALFAVACTV